MKKLLSVLLVAVMLLGLVACATPNATKTQAQTGNKTGTPAQTGTAQAQTGTAAAETTEPAGPIFKEDEPFVAPTRPETYTRGDDSEIYESVLGYFSELMDEAKAASSVDERFVRFAKAEAVLLDSAVFIPTTTHNGAYTISRIAPHTVPYVQWGNDDDRVKGLVISDEFLTKEERADLLDQWSKALKGEGEYDPAAYLTAKGHKLNRTYTTTFSTAPVTLDWLNTSSQADTEITVNTVDGLVEYDNLNRMQPALAESWDISDDGLTYTFHIRKGVKWYTAEGTEVAEVTAKDFVAGLHHMLDADAGLSWLLDGVVKGTFEYHSEGGSWDDVGYVAADDYTLVVTLEKPTSYFLTMLTYSCFLPICESFYASRGGVYGMTEYKDAQATSAYTFGLNTDVSSQVYCGPFLISKLESNSEIVLVKNENYYKKDDVNVDTLRWVKDAGEDPVGLYNAVVAGTYPETGLGQSSGTLDLAKNDGNFDKYAYISDTTSTTFFGGLNVNRGSYGLDNGAVASPKTDSQKIDTSIALLNKNFRKALQFAFDRGTFNATTRGEDLKFTNLRNMYTHPEFVSLAGEVTLDGKTWGAGTFYGEIVQWYLEQLGSHIIVKDGVDGWFNLDAAKAALAAAKEELGDAVNWPIHIDVNYYSQSKNMVAQAQAYKSIIESNLGTDNVIVDLLEASTVEDYYAAGYRATKGSDMDYDMYYGSGWGPDYGDPSTYLDTMLGYNNGYMAKVIGLF